MGVDETKTVIETINEHYTDIFSAEKRVADFILEHPEQAVNSNVSELANHSGVSDATVIRLCKHIGYQGYYQLRLLLSRDIGRVQAGDEPLSASADTVSSVFQSYANALVRIGRGIDEELMRRCCELIRSSSETHIAAVGNTSPLAMYMGFRLERLGFKCTYNMLPEYILNHINLASPNSVMIAISQSGLSKQVVQAMELAREKGMKIIAITGHLYSPVSRLADFLLLSDGESQSFDYDKTYSHLNETAVIDALLYFLSTRKEQEANPSYTPEMILAEYKL